MKRYYKRPKRKRMKGGKTLFPALILGMLLVTLFFPTSGKFYALNPNRLVPWIFLGGVVPLGILAFFNYWRKTKAEKLLRSLSLSNILNMDPFTFENYIASLMKSRGFSVKQTPKQSDYGVDLIATKGGIRWAIQIKHNILRRTGNHAVLEAVGGAPFYQCDRAMVISTTEEFTSAAREQAHRSDCVLVGRKELANWIREYHEHGGGKHQFEYWG